MSSGSFPQSFSVAGPSNTQHPAFISLNSPPNQMSKLPDASARYHPYLPNLSHIPPSTASSSDHFISRGSGSSDSVAPSDSISAVGSINRFSQPPTRPSSHASGLGLRRRGSYAPAISPDMIVPAWSSARKKQFEHRVLRLTASAGFALSWVENPEWLRLCEEFIPAAPRISQKVLTKHILCEVVAEFQAEIKKKTKGKEVTLQEDGWTGLNNHHLVAFMITANKKVCGAFT